MLHFVVRIITALPSLAAAVVLVPDNGALLGQYYGSGTIEQNIAKIGLQPAIHLAYYSWNASWATSDETTNDLQNGRIPLVNWEPFGINFSDIVSGSQDALIVQRADEAKALTKNFFLDFAAEMNEEEGWGGHNPALYIAAWRHIHDAFAARNATNVVWVWCPNNVNSAGAPPAMEYYPGDDYVDWVGADGYNWGTREPGFTWQSFADVFRDIYTNITAGAKGKPMMIGETASAETGGSKAEWVAQIVPTLKSQFPAIKALVWFDVDKERDWPFDSSNSSLAAFRTMAADAYFNNGNGTVSGSQANGTQAKASSGAQKGRSPALQTVPLLAFLVAGSCFLI